MRALTPCVRRFALVLAAAAPLAAQRVATTGRVMDEHGNPVVDASIVFVGAPLPIVDSYTDIDRVEVRSDVTGGFRALLLPLADYSAWAVAPPAGAPRKVSAVRRLVAAGDSLWFSTTIPAPPRELHFTGLEAWDGREPPTVLVAPDLPALQLQPVPCKNDTVVLPPFAEDWQVFLRDERGVIVMAHATRGMREAVVPIAVPPRQDLTVRARTPAGQAIAGANVWMHLGLRAKTPLPRDDGLWQRIGATDADGGLAVAMPIGNTDETLLVAGASDRRPGIAMFTAHFVFAARFVPPLAGLDPGAEVPIVLADGPGTVGVLSDNARVVPRFAVRATPGERESWRLVAGADGPWLANAPLRGSVRLVARLPAGKGHVPAIAWLDPEAIPEQRACDLASVRVRHLDGKATTPWRVVVQPITGPGPSVPPHTAVHLLPGQPLLLSQGPWRLLASDGTGWVERTLDLLPGVTELVFAPQALASEAGRLRPIDGVLPLGAIFHCVAGRLDPAQHRTLPIEWTRVPPDPGPWPALVDYLALDIARWLTARTAVAADGTFVLRTLHTITPRLEVVVVHGERTAVAPHFLSNR
jgi:hypothetical protein